MLTTGETSDLGVLNQFCAVELTWARVQRPLVGCATSHAQIRGFSGGRKPFWILLSPIVPFGVLSTYPISCLGSSHAGEQSEYIRNTVTLGRSQLHRDLKVGVKGAHTWRTRTCRERGTAAPRTNVPLSQSTGSAPAGRATQSHCGSVWPKEEVHGPGPLLCNPEGQARPACLCVEGEGWGLQALPRGGGRACGKRSGRTQAETSQPRRIAIAQFFQGYYLKSYG